MKKIFMVLFITFVMVSSVFAADVELVDYLKKNVGNYIQVFIKKREVPTKNNGILRNVYKDVIVIEEGNYFLVIKIDQIQFMKIWLK